MNAQDIINESNFEPTNCKDLFYPEPEIPREEEIKSSLSKMAMGGFE